MKYLGDNPGELLAYFILGELLVNAQKIVEELGGTLNAVLPFRLGKAELSKIIASKELYAEKLKGLFTAVIDFRDAHREGRYSQVLLRAKEYIENNYNDENISLTTTAQNAGLSPNHFSAVFVQETGKNFIEYLTAIRIEKAKGLLKHSAMKSADIAYEVGFNDPHYFSFIFKKNTGMSPREYRGKKD
jgi:two-component system response regulator YesN